MLTWEAPERGILRRVAGFAPLQVLGNCAPDSPDFAASYDVPTPHRPSTEVAVIDNRGRPGHPLVPHHLALEVRFHGRSSADGFIGLPPSRASFLFGSEWHSTHRIAGTMPRSGARCHGFLALRSNVRTEPVVHLVRAGSWVGCLDRDDLPQTIMKGIVGAVAVDAFATDLTASRLQSPAIETVKREVVRNTQRLLDLLESHWDAGLHVEDRVACLLTGQRDSGLMFRPYNG
jgi:hypothetical protein